MHAVLVRVTVHDREAAQQNLREELVPRVAQAPGFVAGYWVNPVEDRGRGQALVVFDSEEAAQAMAGMVQSPGPGNATIEAVEVCEVVAHA